MAKDAKISRASMQRLLKKDLKVLPYKLQKVQKLSLTQRNKRTIRAQELLGRFAASGPRNILFSDEKIFTLEQSLNAQNDRIWSMTTRSIPDNIKLVERGHSPESLMVWAGVSGKGKTPLIFLDKGVKVNSKIYQEIVLKRLKDEYAPGLFPDGV
jgi:inhibitor of nuclear factor kappa-B kinase subunit alpha